MRREVEEGDGMKEGLLPVGVRRDGSYYTRIEWASHTESDPLLWVCNLIDDDTEREGGTWGAHTMGPANVVLSFFGEEQEIKRIRIFHNVGIGVSILEELASAITIYTSTTDEPRVLKNKQSDINAVPWKKVLECNFEKREGWFEFQLQQAEKARYVRLELERNFGTPPDIPWTETSEVKIYS
jgi:hypothetical protein